MKIPTLEQIIQNQRIQYSNELKKYYPEFFDFLFTEYITKFEISQSEALYWYFNNLSEHPICKICGSKVQYKTFANGYRDFCCKSCLSKSNSLKILYKYGTVCTLTLPDVKQKTIKTLEEHYGKGVKHNWSSKEVQNKCKQTRIELYGEDYEIKNRQKAKQTCLERYGDENYRNIEKAKHTFLEKYGVTHFSKIFSDDKKHDIQFKRQNTLRKNKTFSVSKIEEKFANYLTTNKIRFKRQYKSSVYPFNCDFYLPDKEIYIEINAHWTHGGRPFNNTNKEDLIKLDRWRKQNTDFYNHAIKTWTIRDVQKRECAKKNNLNYLEIFSNKIDDAIIIFEHQIKNI